MLTFFFITVKRYPIQTKLMIVIMILVIMNIMILVIMIIMILLIMIK